ncbi:insulinase family protein [Actinoplanes sp. NPDC051851]|uniref:insulinase family protein n=1 Tax=Actinoplanes sp. NPDC051851 TaxID=3154753 RepID=UPI00343DE1E1
MTEQFDVGGVPAVFAPAAGPTHAGLVFRVGVADEPLPHRGITRLVEHLVPAGHGATGTEHTFFHVHGTADEVRAFLAEICATLRDPSAERIVIARERMRSGRPGADLLPMWRYGARGFGMPSYPEFGLEGVGDERLRDWIGRYFTRGNAALWVAGDAIPDGLTLDLPDGERRPAPAPSSAPLVTPACFTGPGDGVAWDTVVRREPRAAVFANVLERRMLQELRDRDGISSTVTTDYEPRADGSARITAHAGAPPEKRDALLGGMVDVLAGMRAGRFDEEDVAAVVALTRDGLRDAESRGGRLPGQAFNLLAGRPVQSLEEALAELDTVTRDGVAEVAGAAYEAGLLMAPTGTGADWAGYTEVPATSDSVVEGTPHPAINRTDCRLVHGAEGISVVSGEDRATVRYAECVALLAWADGGRQLIGPDGIAVRVEPTLYEDVAPVLRDVDARLPAELRVDLPARPADRIPSPPPSPAEPVGRPWWRRLRRRRANG